MNNEEKCYVKPESNMRKKLILGLLVIFFIMLPTACAWSIFDEPVAENTDHIHIDNIETEWANYSNGFYGYNFDFEINNLSSSHEINSVISFYDSNGDLIKNDNLSGGIDEPISQGEIQDNLTITLEDYQKSHSSIPSKLWGGISNFDYCEIDHIRIDVIDENENKLLCSVNHTFNMSNLWNPDELSNDDKTDNSNSEIPKTDRNYDFFKETDLNGDYLIDFKEFSEISYVFTEDSFWDGYPIEEILQSEWDRANDDGDDYLTFEEFENVI